MEGASEERLTVSHNLELLEQASFVLEKACKSHALDDLSEIFPGRFPEILEALTSLNSRDEAERLLAVGVAIWNSTLSVRSDNLDQPMKKKIVQIRHVAADCMFMSHTVLGGISARYNIDDLSLLKFYTACGQKYATEVNDMSLAEVCFARAADFVDSATKPGSYNDGDKTVFARAMFDLLLGRAECSWEKEEPDRAAEFVSEARKLLVDLPGEHEFLASIEFNFGLYTYQSKDIPGALRWLRRSIETRESDMNDSKDPVKQSESIRLAGVCLLAQHQYEESWKMMTEAQKVHHNPVGAYLVIKLSIITKQDNAVELLLNLIKDESMPLDVCVASASLFGDTHRIADASTGYEAIFERFQSDARAIVTTVGPRYFDTLASLGQIPKALKVLDKCCELMDTLSPEYDVVKDRHESDSSGLESPFCGRAQWSSLLLAAGCAQADRKDYISAAELLRRALDLGKEPDSKSYMDKDPSESPRLIKSAVIDNEAAICRLAASCVICGVDILDQAVKSTAFTNVEHEKTEDVVPQREDLLQMAHLFAERAKELDPSDFTPRLLLFRTYLLRKDFPKAACELRKSSGDIRSFDAGALAEAACAARDVGSSEAVVSALRCILCMDPRVLSKSLDRACPSLPIGFYGSVLLSCVNIIVGQTSSHVRQESELSAGEKISHTDTARSDLCDVLRLGLKGIITLGIDTVFDTSKDKNAQRSIQFLAIVAWNEGRLAGMSLFYGQWSALFEICYELCQFLETNVSSIQMRRMSKLMCACANIENPSSQAKDFLKARKQLLEARQESLQLRDIGHCTGENPIEGLLLILDARCAVGCRDLLSLEEVVKTSLSKPEIQAEVFEQMASIVHSFQGGEAESPAMVRVKCADFAGALLDKAVDCRLRGENLDLISLAVTMREHISVELSRSATTSRAFDVYQTSVSLVLEQGENFPEDERRWLVATGWDRAQMFLQLHRRQEAQKWAAAVARLVRECAALSSYLPRLDAFLEDLQHPKSPA